MRAHQQAKTLSMLTEFAWLIAISIAAFGLAWLIAVILNFFLPDEF
jgi:F0F1-type ATP synthase assembly protein I